MPRCLPSSVSACACMHACMHCRRAALSRSGCRGVQRPALDQALLQRDWLLNTKVEEVVTLFKGLAPNPRMPRRTTSSCSAAAAGAKAGRSTCRMSGAWPQSFSRRAPPAWCAGIRLYLWGQKPHFCPCPASPCRKLRIRSQSRLGGNEHQSLLGSIEKPLPVSTPWTCYEPPCMSLPGLQRLLRVV